LATAKLFVKEGATFPDALCREANEGFAAAVVAGLSERQKQMSPKFFYDGVGSRLFEEICRTEEYYVTRSETGLLSRIASEIAAGIPDGSALVEFGSGECAKTQLLLNAAPQLAAYVPVDISAEVMAEASARLRQDYPELKIVPVVADFTTSLTLPASLEGRTKVGFFPGSTIGNFDREGAIDFLRGAREILGVRSALLIGVDLLKEVDTLIAAYNDVGGVTAEFNKNLLTRINRELGGDFDLDAFEHAAEWNPAQERMEMYLVSCKDQIVNAAGQTFAFRSGERIHTENSHKFTVEGFAQLAAQAGWVLGKVWVSDEPKVAVFRLTSLEVSHRKN
jgi:dimethylhistidine N-methyltransferase